MDALLNAGRSRAAPIVAAARLRLGELVLLRGVLALLSVTVAVLAYEVHALKPQADTLMRNRALPYSGQLVPTARALTLTGDTVILGETAKGRSQVLFFLSASCQYCLQALPAWTQLARQLQADPAQRFDVYGVSFSSPDSTAEFVRTHALPFPVLRIPDRKTRQLFRVKATPITVVTDRDGVIAWVHPSVIATQSQMDSILHYAVIASIGRTAAAAESKGAKR